MSRRAITVAEMRRLDEHTIERIGVPGVVLMEAAGRAVVDRIERIAPVTGRRVVVVAGPGNNGGDGYVVARHLHERRARVVVVRCATDAMVKGDARTHHNAALRSGVRFADGTPVGFEESAIEIDQAELIVDALLGTGSRAVVGHFATVIARINAAAGTRVAVDLPSGLDGDSGRPMGVCVNADHTVTFAAPKVGLVGAPGFTYAGELTVADIGIPARLADVYSPACWLLDEDCLAPLRRPRARDAHKGTFGHLLIVAGSGGKTGAALLCGEAAARAGAGLVTVASPDEAQRALAGRVVELMTEPLGPEPLDGAAAWKRLAPLVDRAREGRAAIAFGPGVGQGGGARDLLGTLLAAYSGPLVIDADGLNLIAANPSLLASHRGPVRPILTPHPAEMGRLASISTAEVQADRLGTARGLAARLNVVVVLKGARTVIALPDGTAAIAPTGNPGMATGGSGDVLTGVIGALLAGGLGAWEAATLGAYWHGAAGDHVARARGEVGMIARDVIEGLSAVLAHV